MPGFSDQLGLERLGLILQFVGGLLLVEALFPDRVLDMISNFFNVLRDIGEICVEFFKKWELSTPSLAVVLALLAWWAPQIEIFPQLLNPWRTIVIVLVCIVFTIVVPFLLVLVIYLAKEFADALTNAFTKIPFLKKSIVVLSILFVVLGFIAGYAATLVTT